MLKPPPDTRIFMAVTPVDMRRSFSGLSAIVSEALGSSTLSGSCTCSAASEPTE
jgi:hypothetical protein